MFNSFRFYDLKKKEYSNDVEINFKHGVLTIATNNSHIIIEKYITPISNPKFCHAFENDLIKVKSHVFIISKTESGEPKIKAANFGAGSVTFGIGYLNERDVLDKSSLIGPVWENLDMLDKLPKSEQQRIKRMLKQ